MIRSNGNTVHFDLINQKRSIFQGFILFKNLDFRFRFLIEFFSMEVIQIGKNILLNISCIFR